MKNKKGKKGKFSKKDTLASEQDASGDFKGSSRNLDLTNTKASNIEESV